MVVRRMLLPLALLALVGTGAQAADLSLTNDGLRIDAGSMGTFALSYPNLHGDGGEVHPLIEKTADGGAASVKYQGGASASLALAGDEVTIAFANMPEDVTTFRMEMLIDFSYSQGGSWRIGDGETTPFPAVQPAAPHLFQGNGDTLTLTSFEGKSLGFTVPQYSYQQLQDNREWNWKIFGWFFQAPYNADWKTYTVRIAEGEPPAGGPVVVVDRFGQDAKADFPEKVTSEDELREDDAREAEYAARLDVLELDVYGGLPGSGERLGLERTGFFHVERKGDKWVLVDPDGDAFFHLGLCGFGPSDDFTYIEGRQSIYEWLPPYDGEFRTAYHADDYWSRNAFSFYLANVIRKQRKPFDANEWRTRMISRVRKWGFNSSGAFSGGAESCREANFPYVGHLPLQLPWTLDRPIPGLRGFFDPFDEVTAAKIDGLFAERVAPSADDPLIIGYYLENEQACEDITRVIPQLKADAPCKQELVVMLRGKYPTIDAFNAAWGMDVGGFDELTDMGLPVTTEAAAADMTAYKERFLEAYYSLLTTIFRKYDPNHMLLGNRWQPGTANDEILVRTAGKYMDVISLNYYTYGLDRSFLERLYEWSGEKPMLLSEWHYCSPSDTGLPGGGPEVSSQQERGLAYRNYVEQAAAMKFVVGCDWFTLLDQARTGRWFERYTGENGNTGIISVTDRPWYAFLDECVKANAAVYEIAFGDRQPFAYDDPRFTGAGGGTKTVNVARAPGEITIDGRRNDWPGTPPDQITAAGLVMGADAGELEAAFRLCWDEQNLYLIADVTDPTPMMNAHEGDSIWSADGLELFIGHEDPGEPGPLRFTDRQVLLSAGQVDGKSQWYYAHAPQQYACNLAVVAGVDGRGYTLEAAMPFEALGFSPQPGQQLVLDLGIDDSSDGQSRDRQLMWNGSARNSGDRTYWGRAKLAE